VSSTPSDLVRTAHAALLQHKGLAFQRDLGVIRELDLLRFATTVAGAQGPNGTSTSTPTSNGLPVAAPPLYLTAVVGWDSGPPEFALLADGTPSEALANLPVGGLRLMGGGQSLELHVPLVAGVRITQESRVLDVRLKEGRTGPLLFIDVERLFLHGAQLVMSCSETFIGR
jgi:hypothetical protein